MIYCLPGQKNFYDMIPNNPTQARQTAEYFLENLLKF